MAKQEKVKVVKSELIEEFDLKQQDFENVVKQMQEMCPDILQIRKRKNENGRSTPSSKKQKKSQDNEEEEDDLDNEGGDDENLPSHCINRKALKQKKYAQWKEDSISASIKLGNSNESNKRKKKQPMITMFMKPRNDEVEPIEDDHNHDDVDNYNDENNQL
eukprot:TRINITY_DN27575_c0_g2_i3.p3 TRINITY_DN27575_c0_g2~~TRINITY_DN27575_c0_g2_i3.p3  ORF type:complete len:161 (-),score=32.03 TRINITY_DN27575_c0_g2_i3:358-840(-)